MRSRRSTATLTLVLIGAAALHGCGNKEEETATRDVYKSRADCQRDWGEDDKKCEQATSGSHAGMFYGPLLYGLASGMGGRGTSFAPRPGSNAVASTQTTTSHSSSVSRGGFGSSASSHSSGG
ncbi:MAG: hypothetical protein JWO70_466 [Betaproteobacteria bacterium]|nr:hypothetical protein [Betaproteobacteria bacterium]